MIGFTCDLTYCTDLKTLSSEESYTFHQPANDIHSIEEAKKP